MIGHNGKCHRSRHRFRDFLSELLNEMCPIKDDSLKTSIYSHCYLTQSQFQAPPVTLGGWWDIIWKGHHGCRNYISRSTDMHIHIQPLGLSDYGTFRSRNKINGNDLCVWHICLMGKLKLMQLLGLLEDTSIQCSTDYSQTAGALRLFSRASLASASRIGPQWHAQEVDLIIKKPELPSFSHAAKSK